MIRLILFAYLALIAVLLVPNSPKTIISVRATGCALPYTTTTSRNTRRLPFFVITAKSVQVPIASASVQRPFLHIGRKEILQTKLEHSMGWGITRQDPGS